MQRPRDAEGRRRPLLCGAGQRASTVDAARAAFHTGGGMSLPEAGLDLGEQDPLFAHAEVLRRYCATGSDADLAALSEACRDVFRTGVSLSTLVDQHQSVVSAAVPAAKRANAALFEALSVYDSAMAGYRESIARLSSEIAERRTLERELRDVTFALAQQRDSLDGEVKRQTVELQARLSELRTVNEQLKQSNREQSEFTYAISHDLKSPINTVGMILDLISEEYATEIGAEGLKILDGARSTSLRMVQIIDDILSYSSAIGKKSEFERVDLNAIVAEVIADLKKDIEAARATIRVEGLQKVKANRTQIRLLFQNLILNAVKFRSEQRGCVVHVKPIDPAPGARVGFSVTDNGIGIAREHHDRIFGLFQRLHTYDAYPGSGLGLTLCKRIVGNHEGTMSLSSRVGHGTTFSVRLWGKGCISGDSDPSGAVN